LIEKKKKCTDTIRCIKIIVLTTGIIVAAFTLTALILLMKGNAGKALSGPFT
jgi:hypothetical protein